MHADQHIKIERVFYLGVVVSRFEHGWVKVSRKLLSQEWTQALDAIGKGLFLELLLMANWKDSDKPLFKHRNICLKAGQLATSYSELCSKLDITRDVLRDRLERLKKLGTIHCKTDNQGTIITICNYLKYQCMESDQDHTESHAKPTAKATAKPTANPTHSKERKELKELKGGEDPTPFKNWFDDVYEQRVKRPFIWTPEIEESFVLFCDSVPEDDLKIIIKNFICSGNPHYIARGFDPRLMIEDANKLRGVGKDGRMFFKKSGYN